MKKRFEIIQIPLIIIISLFVAAVPSYFRCAKLPQAKFVSSDLSFENPDQGEGIPFNQKELKVYKSTDLLRMVLLGVYPVEQTSHLFARPLSLHHKTPVLRC
jgi:hypothetical protein